MEQVLEEQGSQSTQEPKLRRQPGTCFWCGDTRGPHPWQDCPAKGKSCVKCKGNDHFAHVCLETASPGYQPRQNPRQQFRPQRQQQSVNEVQQEHTEEDMVSSPPQYEDFDTYVLPGLPGNKFYANLQLTYRDKIFNHRFQIDSGASCNTLAKSVLTRAFPGLVLAKSKSVLRPYGNGPVIRPCGHVELLCERNNQYFTLKFQVLPDEAMCGKPALLSAADCVKMDILQIKADEVHQMTIKWQPEFTGSIQTECSPSRRFFYQRYSSECLLGCF